jgi:chromosome segregation ATPase
MKKNYSEAEIALQEELKQVKKENKSLTQKLETANAKKSKLQKELKKKDVQRIELSKEQQQSLSNLSQDINILNLLLD